MPALLFCEGTRDSLDALILNRLIEEPGPLIRHAGGKNGLPAFIDGSLASYPGTVTGTLALRDRDFDVVPPPKPALLPLPRSNKPIFLMHRASVESYLISPDLLRRYLSLPAQVARRGNPPALSEVESAVEEAARTISGYQAVRWALASYLHPSPFPPVTDKLTAASGKLPADLAFDACLVAGAAQLERFIATVGNFDMDDFRSRGSSYYDQFSAAEFYLERDYLVWFHGKDLSESIRRRLQLGEMGVYLEWAAENVDLAVYPDLMEWRDRVRQLAG